MIVRQTAKLYEIKRVKPFLGQPVPTVSTLFVCYGLSSALDLILSLSTVVIVFETHKCYMSFVTYTILCVQCL